MKVNMLILWFCVTSIVAFSQKSTTKFATSIKQSKDSIQKLITKKKIPGLSITVMVDGQIVWSEGFGYADLEQKVVVNPTRTKFRIGSISKALTAAGLAKLYEANKIILDSSIYYYLPYYPKHQYRPTVRQIAGHIGGVRHYKGKEWYNTQHFNTVSAGIAMFKDDSLNYKPGTKYEYTSHGFNLLSAVMEKTSKQDFLSFIKREVIKPLKLANTCPDLNDSIIDSRSRFYDIEFGRFVNSPYVDNSYKWAGGGFISCSEDIAVFGNALLGNTLLKPETIKLFTTPQRLADGSFTKYGMGFASGQDSMKHNYFGHSGGSVGGTSDMVIYPNEKIVVVVLTNLSNAGLGSIARDVAQLYMKK